MNFTDEEIRLAKRLRELGLSWEPAPGHYVLDPTGFCKQPSPFQDRVYFILNYPYFMRMVGGVERFKEIMIWLPTWEDLRRIVRSLGADDQQVADHLQRERAIEQRCERVVMYRLAESLMREKVLVRQEVICD